MIQIVHGEHIHGVEVDPQTRCAHYSSPLDIIAIKFNCCGKWFPCIDCHSEIATHDSRVWPSDMQNELAVLCGVCGYQLSIADYINGDSQCPNCTSGFNPGCKKHRHLYFA